MKNSSLKFGYSMQVKKALLKQGEIALASAALLPDPKPRLPIKKPPQLQALAIANDSFHTPTTQRVPALGIPSGSHPTSASTVGTGTGNAMQFIQSNVATLINLFL